MGEQGRGRTRRACAPIELLVVDVDGVLTDGAIVIDDHGVESKHFHVRDGLAYSLWHRAGKHSAILSGRKADVVDAKGRRAQDRASGPGAGRQGEAVPLPCSPSWVWRPARPASWATTWSICPCSGQPAWPLARPTR